MPRRRTARNPSSGKTSSGHPAPAGADPLAPARRDLDSLRELVAHVPPGLVAEWDRSEAQYLLFTAWLAFEGPGRGRSGVIHDPVEMRWEPPVLQLTVRHFAWRHLDLQRWSFDLEAGHRSAVLLERETGPGKLRQDPVDVVFLAAGAARLMLQRRRDDPRIEWSRDGRARVRKDRLLPRTAKLTDRSRRSRMEWHVAYRLEAKGWRPGRSGWWTPPEAWRGNGAGRRRVLTEVLAAVEEQEEDPFIRWGGAPKRPERYRRTPGGWPLRRFQVARGRVRARGSAKNLPSASDFLRELGAELMERGWHRDRGGWWEPAHADLRVHGTVHLCGYCGTLAAGESGGEPREVCLECADEPRDPDFPLQLCRCCAQVLLDRNERALWFCRACEVRAVELNRELGRYALPIGPDWLHDERWSRRFRSRSAADYLIDELRQSEVEDAMRTLRRWSRGVVQRALVERFPGDSGWISIRTWDRRAEIEEESRRRFREMATFLAGQQGPPGVRA
jgi:hypothetical protein